MNPPRFGISSFTSPQSTLPIETPALHTSATHDIISNNSASNILGEYVIAKAPYSEPTVSHVKEEGEIAEDSGSTLAYIPQFSHPVDSEIQRPSSPKRLSRLDICAISNNQVLYYFGVLVTQALLLPRFQFSTGKRDKLWGVKLTMYGLTIMRSHVYRSQHEAKVDVCREALKGLKGDYIDWPVPDEPSMSVAPPGWNLVEILRDYCIHNGVPGPKYTKYIHAHGCRHEVEILGSMYFAALKYYPGELESQNAAAHIALHSLLVKENSIHSAFPGPFILRRYDENLLAHVPRTVPSQIIKEEISTGSRHEWSRPRKRPRRTSSPVIQKPRNANAQPLQNCRLAPIEVQTEKVESKWKVTPAERSRQLQGLQTHVAKLEKSCEILPLELPEIRIERLGGHLIEAGGEYRAGAYFKRDPFLTRAGVIGEINLIKGTEAEVHEACAKKAIGYLISLVEEDTALENHLAKEREAITRYGEKAL